MSEDLHTLDKLIDDCLQAIESGQATLDECLARYPEHYVELERSLRVALALRSMKSVRPSAAFRGKAQARLQKRLADSQRKPRQQAARRVPLTLRLAAGLAILVIGVATITGTVSAADAAGPGDLLYGVDRAVEELQLTLVFNQQVAAELRLAFANERLEEAIEAEHEGHADEVEYALSSFDEAIAALQAMLTDPALSPAAQAEIGAAIVHLETLRSQAGFDDAQIEIEMEGNSLEIEVENEGGDAGDDAGEEEDSEEDETPAPSQSMPTSTPVDDSEQGDGDSPDRGESSGGGNTDSEDDESEHDEEEDKDDDSEEDDEEDD